MQVKGIGLLLCALAEFAGLSEFDSEWYCPLFLSAMYAELLTSNDGHFFYCEGPPCTCLAFLLVCS